MSRITDDRLAVLINGLRIWTENGRSAAPDLDRDALSALKELQSLRSLVSAPVPTHRHLKRGSEYVLIGIGKMQAELWFDGLDEDMETTVDMREVAIYRSVDDGSLWVRPREEFEDGRFEALKTEADGTKPS